MQQNVSTSAIRGRKRIISISFDLSQVAMLEKRLDTFIFYDHLLYAQTFALILFPLFGI